MQNWKLVQNDWFLKIGKLNIFNLKQGRPKS